MGAGGALLRQPLPQVLLTGRRRLGPASQPRRTRVQRRWTSATAFWRRRGLSNRVTHVLAAPVGIHADDPRTVRLIPGPEDAGPPHRGTRERRRIAIVAWIERRPVPAPANHRACVAVASGWPTRGVMRARPAGSRRVPDGRSAAPGSASLRPDRATPDPPRRVNKTRRLGAAQGGVSYSLDTAGQRRSAACRPCLGLGPEAGLAGSLATPQRRRGRRAPPCRRCAMGKGQLSRTPAAP